MIKSLEESGCNLIYGDPAWKKPGGDHEADFIKAASEAIALIGPSIRNTPVSRRILESSPNLRCVAKVSVGVDDIDVEAATELGILVCHAPTEANTFSVSEATVALMLTLLKRIRERDADVRAGKWREAEHDPPFLGRRYSDDYPGLTIGLVGFGRIANRVADLLAPWRMRIISYDPNADPARFLLAGVERVDYETLLRESDLVSFHVVLTPATTHMLSDAQISLMKPTAFVVNTARGRVVDEAAIARALAANRIAGAALDAFEVEPLPADSPLRTLGNKVLLSPHATSGVLEDAAAAGVRLPIKAATDAVLSVLDGKVPEYVYNKEAIPAWRARFGGRPVPRKARA